jgi:two-component system, NtrC family, response regulator AtoC
VGVARALSRHPDVVICDVMMPVMDGHEVLRRLRDYPETAGVPFLFLTARAEHDDRREGMRLGADDYLIKPYERTDLLDAIEARLKRLTSAAPAVVPGPQSMADNGPIVRSAALTRVYDQARMAARHPLSILLLGETGVGKDVLAHAIHKVSPRADGPFVPLHCASIAPTLLESELFGHERGAFTGAAQSREGLFETADGGTVFLDEIGELAPETQVRLLRVLEDRSVLRVGGRSPKTVDVRFVAATNRNLDQAIAEGSFRQDLYYRLGGLTLTVPPLRERVEEIAPLARRFAENFGRQSGRGAVSFHPTMLERLEAHAWPGNVRELRNVIERAMALSTGDVLGEALLPDSLRGSEPAAPGLRGEVRSLERQRIVRALEDHGGNQSRAAEALGISRRTLLNRLDEFDLPRPRKS